MVGTMRTIWAVGPAVGPRSGTRPRGRELGLWMAGVPVYVFMKWRELRAEVTHAAEVVTAPSDGESPLGLTA
jgi:hypothetical protein